MSNVLWFAVSLLLAGAVSAQSRQRAASSYPAPLTVGPTPMPAWVARYNQVKAQGLIPTFAPSVMVNGQPTYPAGSNMNAICSWTVTHCFGPDDTYNAPANMLGLTFDDGPTADSPRLYQFLASSGVNATHFMIGSNVLNNPSIFQQAIASGGNIAVHTWSHQYTTSLTDMQVLGELGWTQQIISDMNGGRVPAYWRPPYGDTDARVRAIAKYVFGMKTIIWNQDTSDWCLNGQGVSSCAPPRPQNPAGLDAEIASFINGPKNPGLVLLEHELNADTVGAFIRAYPKWISAGWTLKAIPDLWNVPWYLNSRTNSAPAAQLAIGSGNVSFVAGSSSSSSVPLSTSTITMASSSAAAAASGMTSITRANQAKDTATVLSSSSKTTGVPPEPYQTAHKNSAASIMTHGSLLAGLLTITGGASLLLA